jgi:hypothetical protein
VTLQPLGLVLRYMGGALVFAAVAMLIARARGYGTVNWFTVGALLALGTPLLLAGRTVRRRDGE